MGIFQPHLYTRTRDFYREFADALSLADHVLLADIYAAREKNTVGVSSEDLLAELQKRGVEAEYCPSFEEMESSLRAQLCEGDLLITMGAGNIVEVGENLVRE